MADADITVFIPTPEDVEADWTDKFFQPSSGSCTYWPAIGGTLVAYGAREPGGPGQWHTYPPGRWLRVDAAFGPAEGTS